MENLDEALKTLGLTLEKYRKNKTMVSPADLEGKYKIPFQKLKQQLKSELEAYLKAFCLEDIVIRADDGEEIIKAINKAFKDNGIERRVGRAAFKNFDLTEVVEIAKEHKERLWQIYAPYFHKHDCLYVAGCCFQEDNPQTPLIYNDLVDKFYNEDTEEWIKKEKPPGDAILIFLK